MKFGVLRVVLPGGELREVQLDQPQLLAGRDASASIVLPHASVARRHARLFFESGRLLVEDLGSESGTFIDDFRLTPGQPGLLEHLHAVRFGEVEAQFVAAEPEAALPASGPAGPATVAATGAAPRGPAPADQVTGAVADIRVALVSPTAALDPGGAAGTAILTVHNRGAIVDELALRVSGLPPEWVTLERDRVPLLPDAREDVAIVTQVPRSVSSTAGDYAFAVTVTSQQTGHEAVATGTVTVLPFTEMAWTLAPSRGRKAFSIELENRGNEQMTYLVEGRDEEEGLRYQFESPALDVPPGTSRMMGVRIAPRRKPWFGAETVRSFQVIARAPGSDLARPVADGQLIIHPPLQPVKRGMAFLLVACLAAIVLTLLILIPQSVQNQGEAQAATAEAAYAGVHLCDDKGQEQKKAEEAKAAERPEAAAPAVAANSGAPFFKQNDPRWGDTEYARAKDPDFGGRDWCGSTIAECGCAMTSVATMLAIYDLVAMPDGESLTPQTLNAYFNQNARRTNRGWVSQGYSYGDVIWGAANQLSAEMKERNPNVRTVRFLRFGSGAEDEVREQLGQGRPVILEVPGHWIAATGIDAATNAILINDPFYETRTTLDAYAGKVKSSVIFEPSEDLSGVLITAPADVRIRVTEKGTGKVVGTLASGSREEAAASAKNEIAGASYSSRAAWRDPTCVNKAPAEGEGTNQILLPGAREDYIIEVLDTAGGATSVSIHTYDRSGHPQVQTLDSRGPAVAALAVDPDSGTTVDRIDGATPAPEASASPIAASPSAAATTTAAAETPTAAASATTGGGGAGASRSTVSAPAAAGALRIDVSTQAGFAIGDGIRINPGGQNQEDAVIAGFGSFILQAPLRFTHAAGEPIERLPAPPGGGGGGGTGTTGPPGTIAPPPAPPVEPAAVSVECASTATQVPRLATLICTAHIDGTFTTTRWTVNGGTRNEYTGQTAMFLSFTADATTAIGLSACNQTACRSAAATETVRMLPPLALVAPSPTPTVAPPPAIVPSTGVLVDCRYTFDDKAVANVLCQALFAASRPFTTVTWQGFPLQPAPRNQPFLTETDRDFEFKIDSATPGPDGFATFELKAEVCNNAVCELSDPYVLKLPVAKTTLSLVPGTTALNNSVTFFAVVTGPPGFVPGGGTVTFRAAGDPIALDVTTTEYPAFAVASLTIPTGNFPLNAERDFGITATYNGGKNILRSTASGSVNLHLDKAIEDLCDSVDNDRDGMIDEDCQVPGLAGLPNRKDLGGGTVLKDISVGGSGGNPTSITIVAAVPKPVVTLAGALSVAPPSGDVDFCPLCARQVYFGIGANAVTNRPAQPVTLAGGQACYNVTLPQAPPGTLPSLGLSSTDLTDIVPTFPGRYYVRAISSLQRDCGNPAVGDPLSSVARIVVQGNTVSRVCPTGSCSSSIVIGEDVTVRAGVTVGPGASGIVTSGTVYFVDTTTNHEYEVPIVNGQAVWTYASDQLDAVPGNGTSPVGVHRFRVRFHETPDAEGIFYFRDSESATEGACDTAPATLPAALDQRCFDVVVNAAETQLSVVTDTPSVELGQSDAVASLAECATAADCLTLTGLITPDRFGPHTGYVQFYDATNGTPRLLDNLRCLSGGTIAAMGGVKACPVAGQQAAAVYLTKSELGGASVGPVTGKRTIIARYCPVIDPGTQACGEAASNYHKTADPGASAPNTAFDVLQQPTTLTLGLDHSSVRLKSSSPDVVVVTVDVDPASRAGTLPDVAGGYGAYGGHIELTANGMVIGCAGRAAADCPVIPSPFADRVAGTWLDEDTAQFTLTFGNAALKYIGAGTYALSAIYREVANDNYGESPPAAPATLTVNPANTVTTLDRCIVGATDCAGTNHIDSPSTSSVGDALRYEVNVTADQFGTMDGDIQLLRDGRVVATRSGADVTRGDGTAHATFLLCTIGTPSPLCDASAPTLPANRAAYSLTARYVGTGNYDTSLSPVHRQTVSPIQPSIVVQVERATISGGVCTAAGPGPAEPGTHAVLMTATVSGAAPQGIIPLGGVVNFTGKLGGGSAVPLGSAVATLGPGGSIATATLCVVPSPTVLPPGTHLIEATFDSASTDYANAATAAGANITVAPVPTTVTLEAAPDHVVLGGKLTLTATLAPGGYGPYGGFVRFYRDFDTAGRVQLGGDIAISNNQATVEIDVLPGVLPLSPTGHSIKALYCPPPDTTTCLPPGGTLTAPTGNYATGTSAAATVVVEKAPPSIVVTFNPLTPALGGAVTLTATLGPTIGPAYPYSGTIEFLLLAGGTRTPLGAPVSIAQSRGIWSASLTLDPITTALLGDVGPKTIVAVHADETYYAAGEGQAQLSLQPYTPAVALAVKGGGGATITTAQVGNTVSLEATLSTTLVTGCATSPCYGPFGGTVEFRRGYVAGTSPGVVLGQAPVSGTTATLTLDSSSPVAALLPASGTAYGITAHFMGGANYAPNVSSAKPLTITKKLPAVVVEACKDIPGGACVSTVTLGDTVKLTATVTGAVPGARPLVGTVSFAAGRTFLGTAAAIPNVLGSQAVLIVNTREGVLDAAGSPYSISADFSADPNGDYTDASSAASAALTVNRAATIVTMTAAPSPAQLGQPLTLTATLAPGGFGDYGGFVRFYKDYDLAGPVQLGPDAPIANNLATVTFNVDPAKLPVSAGHSIKAVYCPPPDATTCVPAGGGSLATPTGNYAMGVSDATTLPVTKAPANITVSFSTPSVRLGGPLTMTATLGPTLGAGYDYQGTIEFFLASGRTRTSLGSPVAITKTGNAWSASLTLNPLTTEQLGDIGTKTIVAVHADEPYYAAGEGQAQFALEGNVPTVGLAILNPSGAALTTAQVGDPVKFEATVTTALISGVCTASPCFGPLSGSVEFRQGYVSASQPGVLLGTAALSAGRATLTLDGSTTPKVAQAFGASGTAYAVTAHYLGGGNYGAAASPPGSLTITRKTPTVVADACKDDGLVACTRTVTLGDTVKLTAVITGLVPGARPISGTVTFTGGGTTIGSAPAVVNFLGYQAVLSVTTRPGVLDPSVSPYPITASFVANPVEDYTDASGTSAQDLVVNKADTTAVVLAAPATVDESGTTTLTATLSPATAGTGGGALFGGSVSFYAETTPTRTLLVGAVSVSGNAATANWTHTGLAAGIYPITAIYSGDDNYNGVTKTASTCDAAPPDCLRVRKTTAVTVAAVADVELGDTVTFTANITGQATALGNLQDNGGSVTFYEATAAGVSALPGTATAKNTAGTQWELQVPTSTTLLARGVHSIYAVYAGNTAYAGGTSAAILQRTLPDSVTFRSIQRVGGNPTLGSDLVVRATLSSGSHGPFDAGSGTVAFYATGGNLPGRTLLPGTVVYDDAQSRFTITVPTGMAVDVNGNPTQLRAGTYTISAVYSGNTNYAAKDSLDAPAVTASVSVGAASTATSTPVATPSTYLAPDTGTSANVTITVDVTWNRGDPVTEGTVVLKANGTAIAVSNTPGGSAGNRWTFTVPAGFGQPLPIGTTNLTAEYVGTSNFAASTSGTLPYVVTIETAVRVEFDWGALTPGANKAVTLRAVLGPAGFSSLSGPACGVNFFEGATLLGNGTYVANKSGYEYTQTAGFAAGSHTIRAEWTGCGDYDSASATSVLSVS